MLRNVNRKSGIADRCEERFQSEMKKMAGRVGGMKKLINFVENINSYKKTNNQ